MRTLGERSAATAHPGDLAFEQHALVATGEWVDGDRAIGHLAPEGAGAGERCRTGSEQGDRRRADYTTQVGDARIGADEYRRAGDEMPELRQRKGARKRPMACIGIAGAYERLFGGSRRPNRFDAPRGKARCERSPAGWVPPFERRAGTDVEHRVAAGRRR